MVEWNPVARSPFALRVPSGEKREVRLVDCTPYTKQLVRSRGVDAFAVPHGRTETTAGGALVVGTAPGEWFVLAPPEASSTTSLDLAADAHVIDLTHGRALLRLTGERSDRVLQKLCAVDLHDRVTPNHTAFRSSVAKVVTDVVREDDDGERSYLLLSEWSVGQYLADAVLDAGARFR